MRKINLRVSWRGRFKNFYDVRSFDVIRMLLLFRIFKSKKFMNRISNKKLKN